MSLKIYNTLTRTKEDFIPLDPDGRRVNMYTCGVTVYDKCHIGHARSLYIFDVIRRYLKFRGYDVRFARNITDVDDKIIHKARELGRTFEDVVEENIDLYRTDLKNLGISDADYEPRATQNIGPMIAHIQALIDKGFAYESGGDVYFKVRAFKDYGKLSGQSVDQMLEAVRIDKGSGKKDPLDFALWKRSKDGEPSWDSPWGEGRPGWHIECSVMSMKELQCRTLDIHAGGLDLQFPHHENEVAQSEALTDQPFAKYWIHHGLLKINGQKMAKSLGNFITVDDALKKYKSVDDIKMFFLSSHYRSAIDLSDDKLIEAHKNVQRLVILFKRLRKGTGYEMTSGGEQAAFIQEFADRFAQAMDDDFNTPQALSHIFDFVRELNKRADSTDAVNDQEFINALIVLRRICREVFGMFDTMFGEMNIGDIAEDVPGDKDLRRMLDERKAARAQKDFARSDELRDQLKARGIIVEDGKSGQTWRWA